MSIKIKALNSSFNTSLDNIPSDKSISHRCAIFSMLSHDTSIIENFLEAEDTINSLEIIKKLGAKVIREANKIMIIPSTKKQDYNMDFYCGNSGTTMRIFPGLLVGLDGTFSLSGDEYLMKRPMDRVVKPLSDIGCDISTKSGYPPILINKSQVKAFDIVGKVPSAQVKSALILAGLKADGVCYYEESIKTRDHSENMLIDMGANIRSENNKITIKPMDKPLGPINMIVPSDPSSAFFFAVLTCITKNSHIILKNVSLNETRIEAFEILKKMGANIIFRKINNDKEPIGDIEVFSSSLKAVEVQDNMAWLIDEIPALAIAFVFASGKSVIKNAKELRVKECDRISAVVDNLKSFGIEAKEFEDGFEVIGSIPKSGNIKSYGDHRIAMSFTILALMTGGEIDDIDCIKTSFPNFFEIIDTLRKGNI